MSSASYVTGDAGADFGNSFYNDHHFHYGYFIYAAAVIGYLDPSWIPINKAYVNTLVRDISNPSTRDQMFPVWRCFDWYHGHSWAHGLFETLDGKVRLMRSLRDGPLTWGPGPRIKLRRLDACLCNQDVGNCLG